MVGQRIIASCCTYVKRCKALVNIVMVVVLCRVLCVSLG